MIDQLLGDLWHKDELITDGQMACRAFVVFLLAIILVRLAGRRAFGMRSPFDTVISLLLGATLSRGIVGASSFTGTLGACLVLAILHRLLAYLSIKSSILSRLVSGEANVLYVNGQFNRANMTSMLVSERDIEEAVRLKGQEATPDNIEQAFIERNGEISVVKK
ncbi:DUF421 domain-containing protein [Spirosoma luteum]|uniref:DUF421 domain-containing protein n=1 Tax=Spirosoma luteum TaxID=431553 RepID=UPI00039F86BA|nr:YetF domain-containing protein [Spirosoma luteum]